MRVGRSRSMEREIGRKEQKRELLKLSPEYTVVLLTHDTRN